MKTKIKKASVGLFLLLSLVYIVLHTPVIDTFTSNSGWKNEKIETTKRHVKIFVVGDDGAFYGNLKHTNREIDYKRLFLELSLIGAGITGVYLIASIFIKDEKTETEK